MEDALLLTGFEPFGGDALNPSAQLIQALAAERIGGLRVVAQVLPCTFAGAPLTLARAVAHHRPRLVLATGLAGGRSELSFERVAINLIDARIPDNAGAQPVDDPVVPGGPTAHFATLPVKAMVQAARAAGVPAGVSFSAGSFVCNQVFYALQHLLASEPAGAPLGGGFVHLPWLPEQAVGRPGQPSMTLGTMALGLRAALLAAVTHPTPLHRNLAATPWSEGQIA